jgi:uridine kinase
VPSDPAAVAAEVLGLALSRPPSLGTGRLVMVDGPAGSGKSTLAAEIGRQGGAEVLQTDEMLEGWGGLPGLPRTLGHVLETLAEGCPATWRRWDWLAGRWGEEAVVEPGDLLVVEGSGAWAPAHAALVTTLVWVEAPSDVRLRRGLARDGEEMRPQWEQWRRDEDEVHTRCGTRAAADVVVDTDD